MLFKICTRIGIQEQYRIKDLVLEFWFHNNCELDFWDGQCVLGVSGKAGGEEIQIAHITILHRKYEVAGMLCFKYKFIIK